MIEARPGYPGAGPSVGGMGGHFGAPHEADDYARARGVARAASVATRPRLTKRGEGSILRRGRDAHARLPVRRRVLQHALHTKQEVAEPELLSARDILGPVDEPGLHVHDHVRLDHQQCSDPALGQVARAGAAPLDDEPESPRIVGAHLEIGEQHRMR